MTRNAATRHTKDAKYRKTEAALAGLTPEQRHVTQEGGTERAFRNAYWDNTLPGLYVDVVSGEPLFSSTDKQGKHQGWPGFSKPVTENVVLRREGDGDARTEVRSRHGDSHLGHVFRAGSASETGQHYCINSAALRFIPVEDLVSEGYGDWVHIFDEAKENDHD